MQNNNNELCNIEFKKEFIYKAIDDATNTIRFLDTKIGVVFVVIGLTVAFLGGVKECIFEILTYFKKSPVNYWIVFALIIVYTLLTVISVIYGFKAVIARNNPIKHISHNGSVPPSLWYLSVGTNDRKVNPSLSEYIRKINLLSYNDLLEQISIELMKVNYIRDEKLKKSNLSIRLYSISLIPFVALLGYILVFYVFIK